jgi:hypothetical protein
MNEHHSASNSPALASAVGAQYRLLLRTWVDVLGDSDRQSRAFGGLRASISADRTPYSKGSGIPFRQNSELGEQWKPRASSNSTSTKRRGKKMNFLGNIQHRWSPPMTHVERLYVAICLAATPVLLAIDIFLR